MKKILFSIAACAAVLAGCTTQEPEMQKSNAMPFSARINEDLTKVTIDNLEVSWESGEEVFVGAMDAVYTSGTVAVAKSAIYKTAEAGTLSQIGYVSGDELTLSDITATGAKFIAFSPASMASVEGGAVSLALPATQTYITDGVKEFPMVGFSKANPSEADLDFSSLCGALKFNLTGAKAGQTVKSISISADQDLSGAFEVAVADGKYFAQIISGSKTVSLDCGDGVELSTSGAASFYVSLPQGTFTGVKITFAFADGGSQTFSSGSNDIVIVANALYTINLTVQSRNNEGIAILPTGTEFCLYIKQHFNAEAKDVTPDKNVRKIVFNVNSGDSEGLEIHPLNSDNPVYMKVDDSNGIVYINTPAGALYANEDAAYMFQDFGVLEEIVNLNVLDTRNVTTMRNMFSMFECDTSYLTTLDLSNFNTENVTTFRSMFNKCKALQSVDFSSFYTPNVESLSRMFANCVNLSSIKFGDDFITENVTDMSYMFQNCDALKSLDLSGFETVNVTDMSYMFSHCWGLKSLDLSNFTTDVVITFANMFFYCKNLETLDVSNFNIEGVASASALQNMFNSCYKLKTLDLTSFNGLSLPKDGSGNLKCMDYIFNQLGALEELWLGPDFASKSYGLPYTTFVLSDSAHTPANNRTATCNTTGQLIIHCTQTVADWVSQTGFRWIRTGYTGKNKTRTTTVDIQFVDLYTGNTITPTNGWRAD